MDVIVTIYNKLDDIVVGLIDKVNPACAVSQDVCHAMDKLIVEAAKTYVGLPPSLPNYDELKGMGEQYLTDLAAQQMESAGVPCPQECKDQLKAGMDTAFNQIKEGYNHSSCWSEDHAHELGFEDGICPPDGVKTVPDPRGQYTDGIVTVQVTRKPGFKDEDIPPSCALYAGGDAENDFWIGKSLGLEGPNRTTQEYISWQGTHLSGHAITDRQLAAIPPIAEDQPLSIPVLVSRVYNPPYWIPGHDKVWKGFIPDPTDDDWAYLYHGSTLNVSASSNCAADPSNMWSTGPVIGPLDTPMP